MIFPQSASRKGRAPRSDRDDYQFGQSRRRPKMGTPSPPDKSLHLCLGRRGEPRVSNTPGTVPGPSHPRHSRHCPGRTGAVIRLQSRKGRLRKGQRLAQHPVNIKQQCQGPHPILWGVPLLRATQPLPPHGASSILLWEHHK